MMMSSNCPRCGALLTGGACISCGYTPEEGASPAGAAVEGAAATGPTWQGEAPPWEERQTLGFITAFWRTWRDSVFRPVPFFRKLASSGPKGPALAYFTMVTAAGLFFWLYWITLENILGGGLENLAGADQLGFTPSPGQQAALLIAGTFVVFVFLIFLIVGFLFITAAVVHLGFAVVGAGRQGFDGTFRALAYSSGPALFGIFPFFGSLLSLIWGTVILFIAVREVQRTTNVRATLGFLAPAVAFLILFLIAVIIFTLLLSSADVGTLI